MEELLDKLPATKGFSLPLPSVCIKIAVQALVPKSRPDQDAVLSGSPKLRMEGYCKYG